MIFQEIQVTRWLQNLEVMLWNLSRSRHRAYLDTTTICLSAPFRLRICPMKCTGNSVDKSRPWHCYERAWTVQTETLIRLPLYARFSAAAAEANSVLALRDIKSRGRKGGNGVLNSNLPPLDVLNKSPLFFSYSSLLCLLLLCNDAVWSDASNE